MGKRLAILKVTREQLNCDWVPSSIHGYSIAHHVLKLPANAAITGISEHTLFDEDLVAVRIECPDFREVQQGEKIPTVSMIVNEGDGSFCRWGGMAVDPWSSPTAGGYLIPTFGPGTSSSLSTVDGGGWSPAIQMKPGDQFTMAGERHVVVESASSGLGPATEGTRICVCPVADMLANGWRCTCGAKTE